MHQAAPAPEPAPEPPVREAPREPPREVLREPPPARRISIAALEDLSGEELTQPAKSNDIDYLDAQLGLTASVIQPAAQPGTPARRRPERRPAPVRSPRKETPEEVPVVEPAPRESAVPRPTDTPSPAMAVAVAVAIIALAIAILVHVFAPNAIPGYTAAEVDLMVQMRAVEWLLGGILAALVGILLGR